MRRFALSLLAGLISLGPAWSQTCYTLQAELAHLQSQGSGGDRARYERAFREQARVLARTETRARNAGCFGGGGFLLFRRKRDPACETLVPKLGDMQANLAKLDRLRMRGGVNNSRRVREVKRLIAARRCDASGAEEQWAEAPPQGDVFDGAGMPVSPNGSYRTLCVRTCDGYYFPISYATNQSQFGQDAQTCQSMCPGAPAALYHANPGGGPEDMTALTGRRYADLPTAFQYRTSIDAACTCRPAGGSSTIAANPIGGIAPGTMAALEPAPFVPRPRPAPGEDPETLADRMGGFVPGRKAADPTTAAATGTAPDGRPIRVVGPVFGASPDQQDVILNPVPN